jgi:serine/threonine-protein kinase
VADFGIALAVAQAGGGRITETGLSLGTPYYMSPEQATGDRDVNPRSDVYALGCVLFEMLAGEPPFAAPTAQAVLAKILTSDAPLITAVRRTVPPHVESALAQALEKLPADRFGSAAEFSEALEDEGFSYLRKVRTAPIATAPVQVVAAPAPPRGPGRGVVVATAAVALVATRGPPFTWENSSRGSTLPSGFPGTARPS